MIEWPSGLARDRKIREDLVVAEESLDAAKRLFEGEGGRSS
jgi:hypothetical protein